MSGDKNSMKSSIGMYVSNRSEKMEQLGLLLDGIKLGNEARNTAYAQLIKESVLLTNQIKASAIEEGCEFGIDEGLLDFIKVEVTFNDDITHISFDNLLPLRTKGYTLNERDTIRRVYLKPLSNAEKRERYTTKVVMCFVHTFEEGAAMIDHDNFEAKPVIDAIASMYLFDDSPRYVSYYMDYKVGKKSKTDIYLVPESRFVDFMNKLAR